MAKQLKSAIARIFTPGGRVVGAGFLVTKTHLFTCAHVVAQSLEIPFETGDAPHTQVELDFPLVAAGEKVAAKVIYWRPAEDVAVLELINGGTAGTHPVELKAAEESWRHSFRAFGFPDRYDDGVWAEGRLLDRQAKDWVQIQGEGQTGYFVAPGFSGTAVWDVDVKGVVGMVVGADKRSDVRAAYIIPTDKLEEAWPELEAVLRAEARRWTSEPLPLPQDIALPGESVIFTCNRVKQDERFQGFFFDLSSQRPRAAQAYFIPGELQQSPSSLVRRFRDTWVREYVLEREEAGKTRVVACKFNWPDQDDLKARQRRLPFALLRSLDKHYKGTDLSVDACRRILTSKYADAVLVIEHNIERANWDRHTRKLINWYLDYWDEVKSGGDTPSCLLFFNVIHPSGTAPRESVPLRWAQNKTGRLSRRGFDLWLRWRFHDPKRKARPRPADTCCASVVLQELTCVTLNDVLGWFHRININDARRLAQWCVAIFGTDDPKHAPCRSMFYVEGKLSELRQEIEAMHVAGKGTYS